MDLTRAFTEAWGDIVDRSEPYFDFDDVSAPHQRAQYATMRRDRIDGRFLPVYDNELDLSIIRAMARLMHERVPMAKGKTKRLIDYTISTGFDWSVKHDSKQVTHQLNRFVERVFEDNRWTVQGERDSFEAECVDGEFLCDLNALDGQVAIRWQTADNLTEPMDPVPLEQWKQIDYPCNWLFGVATPEHYPDRPRFYHLIRDDGGHDWDLVPAKRMIHWRRNVPQIAKRGFSDAYTTHVYLGRADKVLSRTAEGAAIQAAIAYIVEHVEGTTSTQARNVVSGLLNRDGRNHLTGQYQRTRKIVPGQRIDIPAGMKYHAGLFGKSNNDIYVQVMETLIRLSGTVEAFPEHMLTGFAGNNNMASSLTAESPFVQGRLVDQEVRRMRIIELIKKLIRFGVENGAILRGHRWEEVEEGLEVIVSPPAIVNRDPLQHTQALAAQKDLGVISDRTISQELQLDYDQEQSQRKQEAAENPKGAGGGAGGPGGPEGGAGGAPPGPPGAGPPGPAEESGGEMAGLSRLQWQRNRKAIEDVLSELKDGAISPAKARILLSAVGGLSDAKIDALVDEVVPPEPEGEPEPGKAEPAKVPADMARRFGEGLFRY